MKSLLTFILLIFSISGSVSQTNQNDIIGEINGANIYLSEFREKLDDYMQINMDGIELDSSYFIYKVWADLLKEKFIEQMYIKYDLNISEDSLKKIAFKYEKKMMDVLELENREFWTEEMFDLFLFQPARYYDEIASAEATKEMPRNVFISMNNRFKDSILFKAKQKILIEKLKSHNIIIYPDNLDSLYKIHNAILDYDLVAVDHSKFWEKLLKRKLTLNDKIAQIYYENHKDEYFEKYPTKKVKIALMPLEPSRNDSLTMEKVSIKKYSPLFKKKDSAYKAKQFNEAMRIFSGRKEGFVCVDEIEKEKVEFLSKAKVNEVSSPIEMYDGTYFVRLDAKRYTNETIIRARHIVIESKDDRDAALAQANEILKMAKKSRNFGKLARKMSAEWLTAFHNGDLGFIRQGVKSREFDKACFVANEGDIIGPLPYKDGFHIVKIEQIINDELQYSEFKIKPTMSEKTRKKLYNLANKAKNMMQKGYSAKRITDKLSIKALDTYPTRFKGLASQYIRSKVFESDSGAVFGPIEIMGDLVVFQALDYHEDGYTAYENDLLLLQYDTARAEIEANSISALNKFYEETGTTETYDDLLKKYDLTMKHYEGREYKDFKTSPESNDPVISYKIIETPVNEFSKPFTNELGSFIVRPIKKDIPEYVPGSKESMIFLNRIGPLYFDIWLWDKIIESDIKDYRQKYYQNF